MSSKPSTSGKVGAGKSVGTTLSFLLYSDNHSPRHPLSLLLFFGTAINGHDILLVARKRTVQLGLSSDRYSQRRRREGSGLGWVRAKRFVFQRKEGSRAC